MKYLATFALSISLCYFACQAVRAESFARLDSIGTETANGKIYVLHKMDAGQTLFAVVRRYQTSISAVRAANPGMNDQVQIGQVIRVPYAGSKPAKVAAKDDKKKEKAPEPAPTPAAPSGTHVVEAGQTLYSLSVRYRVLMAELVRWNKLTSEDLQAGQELIVSEKTYLARNPTPVAPPKVIEKEKEKEKETVPTVPVLEKPKRPTVEPTDPAKSPTGKKVSESGLAEMIETQESSSKYLALHHSAPVGTLMQVKNAFNQEMIWVKIVGRIPDTSINEDIVIKLSTRAFEKLSPNSRRFRAEISYISAN